MKPRLSMLILRQKPWKGAALACLQTEEVFEDLVSKEYDGDSFLGQSRDTAFRIC